MRDDDEAVICVQTTQSVLSDLTPRLALHIMRSLTFSYKVVS